MSEEEAQVVEESNHPEVEELARFLLSYDLEQVAELPEGCEPIVPDMLRHKLIKALEAIDKGRQTVIHARLRLALEKREIGGRSWVFAGVSPSDLQDRLGEVMNWNDDPAEDGSSTSGAGSHSKMSPDLPDFDQHFRGLRGEFYAMRPRDLIQFFCSCGTTVEVYFTNNLGERGEVLVERGTVLHVEAHGLTGNEAARRIMDWESGSFITRPLRENPPNTVDLTWIHLLLEHAQAIDESGEQPIVDPDTIDETLESLPNWMDAG
jgi:hypothetical protein